MSDTVILLGAGFSHAAGIPLMAGFVDTMWEIGVRAAWLGVPISDGDKKIFSDAIAVRHGLNGYHGRAQFDDRDIEDILSMLTFRVLAGDKDAEANLKAINRAIARTIEITCNVTHPGIGAGGHNTSIREGPDFYRSFWRTLIDWAAKGNAPPTIITFNYDLVLERSLLQVLIGTGYYNGHERRFPKHSLRINYHSEKVARHMYDLKYVNFENHRLGRYEPGSILAASNADESDSVLEFDLLKLHGSLNFPQKAQPRTDFNIAAAVDDPVILPPIFNKLSGTTGGKAWQVAIQRMQQAKNLIVVGYSLPRTDVYMQYFLKSALGPNLDFNRLFVFDPMLYRDDSRSSSLKDRYEECFSPQMRQRIIFRPQPQIGNGGTAQHFATMLSQDPSALFF